MENRHADPGYVKIWVWLMVLFAVGLLVIDLPFLVRQTVLVLLFAIALAKAVLVTRYYMHLRGEHLLILTIAGVPVVLVIGMVLTLIPDIILGK